MEYGDCITRDRKIRWFYMNFNLSFLNKIEKLKDRDKNILQSLYNHIISSNS